MTFGARFFSPGLFPSVLSLRCPPPPISVALSSKLLQRRQIRHMKQLVHVLAGAYFVHKETLQISFGIIFYALGMLLNY